MKLTIKQTIKVSESPVKNDIPVSSISSRKNNSKKFILVIEAFFIKFNTKNLGNRTKDFVLFQNLFFQFESAGINLNINRTIKRYFFVVPQISNYEKSKKKKKIDTRSKHNSTVALSIAPPLNPR